MNIICIYNISGRLSTKVMNILRKYLFHLQRSVFQGKLTPSKFRKLQDELAQISLKPEDQIRFFFTYRDEELCEKTLGMPNKPRNII